MLDLSTHKAPFDIALPYGLSVTVKPLTTAGMAAAQAAARRAVEAIERQARERTEAGLALDALPDLSSDGERDGFYQAQLIRDLPRSWWVQRSHAGTSMPLAGGVHVIIRASAAGTSSQAEGPNTAEPVGKTACPAREGSQEPMDSSVPTANTP